MKVKCPNCGATFNTSRPIGEGTNRKLKILNLNQQEICKVLIDYSQAITPRTTADLTLDSGKVISGEVHSAQAEYQKYWTESIIKAEAPTVSEIRRELNARRTKRWTQWDYRHRFPSGYWDDHEVQINLSMLVGNALVTMVKGKPRHQYYMTKEQIKAYTNFPKKAKPPPPIDVIT